VPELPEVETIVRGLRPLLVGRTMKTAALSHDDLLEDVTRRTLLTQLPGRTITAVTRRAKHALVHTDTKILAVQPGMTGALLHFAGKPTDAQREYGVLVCQLDRGWMIYRDVRRIGTLRWMTPEAWDQYQRTMGPEPLDPDFTAEQFADRMHRSRAAIKKVLMDQKAIVGVGNIYASESLWSARIDPSKPANKVPRDQLLALHGHVRRILQAAIDSSGTTFRDYVTGTGEAGNFQLELNVYGREGEPCRNCGRRLTGTHEIDGRGTVFCHHCQR
jgi:formamidopyrimidine-DNA glycosylase